MSKAWNLAASIVLLVRMQWSGDACVCGIQTSRFQHKLALVRLPLQRLTLPVQAGSPTPTSWCTLSWQQCHGVPRTWEGSALWSLHR